MFAATLRKVVVLFHAVEGWFFSRLIALRERAANYEKGALARLHAQDLKDALKVLHFHVQDLEKRCFIDESHAARRARELIAKI